MVLFIIKNKPGLYSCQLIKFFFLFLMAYRLWQFYFIDLNGVDMLPQNSSLKNVFNSFEVVTDSFGNTMVIKVLDAQGRIAKTISQNVEERLEKIRVNMDDLRRGKYTINIFTDDTFIKAVYYTKI